MDIDGAGGLAALCNGPDNQRLAAPHVAGGKDVGHAGLKPAEVRLHVAARILGYPELAHNALVHRVQEPHCQQH